MDVISSRLDCKSASPLEELSRVGFKAAEGLAIGETMTELFIVAHLGFPWLAPARTEGILGLDCIE